MTFLKVRSSLIHFAHALKIRKFFDTSRKKSGCCIGI